jgi:hypothetical protein
MPAVSAENEHEGWKDDAPDEISNLGFNKVDTSPFIFKLQFDVLGGKSNFIISQPIHLLLWHH